MNIYSLPSKYGRGWELSVSRHVNPFTPHQPSRSPTTTITTNGDAAKPHLRVKSAVAQGCSRREAAAGEFFFAFLLFCIKCLFYY